MTMIRKFKLYQYSIPVDSQLILRNRFLKKREGLLVQVCCDDAQGWGEIAPLPEFSQETLEQAREQALAWLEEWSASDGSAGKLPLEHLFPSVAFGLSCALAEMKGLLHEEGNYQVAPLCYGDPDELYDPLNQMQGEKVAKIKVGMYEANRDGLIADMLLEAIPDLHLRLDANRSWTPNKAQMFAKYVKPEHRARIQFLEEPCKAPAESLQFAEETGIAIAWDETVRDAEFQQNPPHFFTPQVKAIVIKPTLVGSIQRCVELIKQAHAHGIQAVISSSIESSLGLTQLARLAQQYTPNTVPGLDTLDLMDYQVIRPWPSSTLPLIDLDSEYIVPIKLD
ncbi:TPA: o-succinylbenzoate synthase [Pasteurella multocida]|nr:o-succinylbenzoate synthase [Pasteurella multocida]